MMLTAAVQQHLAPALAKSNSAAEFIPNMIRHTLGRSGWSNASSSVRQPSLYPVNVHALAIDRRWSITAQITAHES
jgi:hypothetical protein